MNIRDIIDTNKESRNDAKFVIEQMIEDNRLKGPDGYGVIFEGYTMARYVPWVGKYEGRMGFGMSEDRMFMIEQFAKTTTRLVAIECGVYTGWVTKLLLDIGFHRVIAYDTFEGIKGAKDDEMFKDGDMSVADCYDEVMERIKGAEVVVGEVPYTLKEDVDYIDFAHLDMDVYEPTFKALKYILPRLSSFGIIMLDDYGNWMTPGIKKAVDELSTMYSFKLIYLPTGQAVIME